MTFIMPTLLNIFPKLKKGRCKLSHSARGFFNLKEMIKTIAKPTVITSSLKTPRLNPTIPLINIIKITTISIIFKIPPTITIIIV